MIGKAALESGALFGLLMGVGGLIRCEEHHAGSFGFMKTPPKSTALASLPSASIHHQTSLKSSMKPSMEESKLAALRATRLDYMLHVNRKF